MNLVGESALKVVLFEHMLLPTCLLSVIRGSTEFDEKQRAVFFQPYFLGSSVAAEKRMLFRHHPREMKSKKKERGEKTKQKGAF